MLRESARSLWRSVAKNEHFTILNVFGLSIGFVGFVAIMVYVINEQSYDKYNKNFYKIYRVNTDTKLGDKETSQAIAAPPVASALLTAYPEIENAVRIFGFINCRKFYCHLPGGERSSRESCCKFESGTV